MTRLQSALWLPIFDELADPAVVARLAAEAEEAGWHGVFVWDHLRWRAPVQQVADPWITMAAIATATESLRFGPMVTPLARRRPAKLARETATLDRLSGGRLTLGVGLGSDRYGQEFSGPGDETDDRRRGEMLDESLEILAAAWSGEPVHHHGEHYTVDGIFLPSHPDSAPRRAGVGRGTARQRQTAAPRRPPRRLLPGESRTPRPARRRRHHHRRPARATRRPRTTSPSPSHPARIRRRTSRQAPRGG